MITIPTHEIVVTKLQALAKEWAEQFEEKPNLDLVFQVTAAGQLTVNGHVLCAVSDVKADEATYDLEYLYIPVTSGEEYEVYLDCPYEGTGRIGHIKRISTVYCAV